MDYALLTSRVMTVSSVRAESNWLHNPSEDGMVSNSVTTYEAVMQDVS